MLGVVTCWNEEDCVGNAVRWLLEAEHEVHVFDHGSTDGTLDLLAACFGADVTVHRLDRSRVPFMRLFRFLSRWIAARGGHDWVTLLPADELLFPPSRESLRRAHIEEERRRGTQVIDPLVRRFWISNADREDEPDYQRRLRHFIPAPGRFTPRSWLRKLTRVMPHGLHRRPWEPRERRPRIQWPGAVRAQLYWPKGTRINRDEWHLDHYPIRSLEQGRRKVKQYPQGPNRGRRRYQEYAEGKRSLVYDATEMSCLDIHGDGGA